MTHWLWLQPNRSGAMVEQRLMLRFGFQASIISFTSKVTFSLLKIYTTIAPAWKIIGYSLRSLDLLYKLSCLKEAKNILKELLHPGNHLFDLWQKIHNNENKDKQIENSFDPQAITAQNGNNVQLCNKQGLCDKFECWMCRRVWMCYFLQNWFNLFLLIKYSYSFNSLFF